VQLTIKEYRGHVVFLWSTCSEDRHTKQHKTRSEEEEEHHDHHEENGEFATITAGLTPLL
jgi:hypothetical protein